MVEYYNLVINMVLLAKYLKHMKKWISDFLLTFAARTNLLFS